MSASTFGAPPELVGRHVRLLPLSMENAEALFECREGDTFRYLPSSLGRIDEIRQWVAEALAHQAAGKALAYAIESRHDGRIVGTTRFLAIELAHARAEIGGTFLHRNVRRTPVNTECKRLLLAHGFESMQLNRIELKTDSRNTVSRAAIARIGGIQEGIFRQHMVMPDGALRDTVWFSIIRPEWPAVRDRLDAMLDRPFEPTTFTSPA